MTVKFALLGAGFIGKEHARNIAINPRSRPALICGPSRENGKALAERYGAAYAPEASLSLISGVDAVLIASATDAQAGQIEMAAGAGKPVLCEKPISGDFAAGLKAVETARRAGVFGAVGFNRRYLAEHSLLAARPRCAGIRACGIL